LPATPAAGANAAKSFDRKNRNPEYASDETLPRKVGRHAHPRAAGDHTMSGRAAESADRPRGKLIVVSAPSGAGKTSLVHELIAAEPNVELSVSYTTRAQRPGERDGVDYFFVDQPTFAAMARRGQFLEHARVFDNYYGTGADQVERALAAGKNVILEIDWQGARQVRAAWPDCLSVFVLPPSRAELERRLRGRGTDSEAVIARRLADSVADMRHWAEFDCVVVNADFDTAVNDLRRVVAGHTDDFRADRPGIRPLLKSLLED
jgi:guanylate kinase